MRDDKAGFTLIELMIVIAIIAIIAAIAIPNLLSARLSSNEAAAIATMRNIVSAQAQFQTTAKADENFNGMGEYGFFAELSGAIGVRGGTILNPPVLSTAFRGADANGVVTRGGYLYILALPGATGNAIPPSNMGLVDPDLAEAHVLAMERLLAGEKVGACNLGTGLGHSNREVIAAVEAATGKSLPLSLAERRPGDPPELVADPRRARSLLGWTPQHSDLETIVETAWTWLRHWKRL